MHRIFLILTILVLSACNRQDPAQLSNESPMLAAAPASASMDAGLQQTRARKAEPQRRYIALSHQLVIDTSGSALQAVFEDALKRCEQAGCEILSSNLQRETAYAQPSANLSARMPPDAVASFLNGFGKDAEIVQHTRSADDKTDAVIDAEARIANLTALRDRLRAMQARPGKLSDALEVERQLATTQSELDSMIGQRKALANQTEKVALNIEFRTRPGVTERSFFAPVIEACREAGHVLMSSLGNVITFVAAVLPWLLVFIPVFLLVRSGWRKWRTKRQTRSAS